MENLIYLDTNVILWLSSGSFELLSKRVIEIVENSDNLIIAPIIFLELTYLYELGRITYQPEGIIENLKHSIGLSISEKSFNRVVKTAAQLRWTRDPFDRIITAYAAIDNQVLLTKDRIILANYSQALW